MFDPVPGEAIVFAFATTNSGSTIFYETGCAHALRSASDEVFRCMANVE